MFPDGLEVLSIGTALMPIIRWVDDIASTGARFEYWFFNFRAGDLSILIDFIVRPATTSSDVEIRISRWVRGAGSVEHRVDPRSADPGAVASSAAALGRSRASGAFALLASAAARCDRAPGSSPQASRDAWYGACAWSEPWLKLA